MVKVGICGCGFIGKVHGKAWRSLGGAAVAGCYDVSPAAVQSLAAELGTKPFESFEGMLAAVDVVSICVPTCFHRPFAVSALEAGKHVLCEKPIALTLEDASAIVAAAAGARAFFMVGLTHRFYTENVLVHEAAASGRLGTVLSCSAYRLGVMPDWSAGGWMADPSKSGGAATDFVMHDIDLCNWIGGQPTLVMAQGIKSSAGSWDYMDISIHYASGIKGFVEGGWLFKGTWPFSQEHRILGTKGAAQWVSRMAKNIEKRMSADSKIGIYIEGEEADLPAWPKRDPFEREMEYFLQCVVSGNRPSVVTPLDAYRALQVSLAARQSAETLSPVHID
jgi:UDP-N-acetylglucosamine 3-dehydrogenase